LTAARVPKAMAVLVFGDKFGGEEVFERFFRADVETSEGEDDGEQATRNEWLAKEQRCGLQPAISAARTTLRLGTWSLNQPLRYAEHA